MLCLPMVPPVVSILDVNVYDIYIYLYIYTHMGLLQVIKSYHMLVPFGGTGVAYTACHIDRNNSSSEISTVFI